MTSDEDYVLPLELLKDARAAESELRQSIQHVQGGMLVYRQVPVLQFTAEDGTKETLYSSDLIHFLSPLSRTPTFDSAEPNKPKVAQKVSFSTEAGKKIRTFVELSFYDLRDLICKKGGLSAKTIGTVTGLTHWLMQKWGVQEELAKATATAMLVAILSSTKGAFCKMTDKEAKAALERVT